MKLLDGNNESTRAKRYFCTFADSRMRRSVSRIKKQAHAIGVYDHIISYDENELNPQFREKFNKELVRGSRGFAHWVWKPQIILQTFEKMNECDLVHYCDTGCWINPKGTDILLEYFEHTAAHDMLAFQVKNSFGDPLLDAFSLPEYKWTKGDLFDYFGVRNDNAITQSQQIGATTIFLKKNQKTETLLRAWLSVFETDFRLANDTPSISPNFDGFIEHRHDQSILGILCKMAGVQTRSTFEYFYPSTDDISKPDWKKIEKYPIWAKRDKDLGTFGYINHKIRRLLSIDF